ncbi:MAG TPA: OPT family oligopeptide transporter [Candidatus Paceibacterota bacterium]|nr:OPT family oligopeptide transporter [Verrucomicrobiota bacterium]HRY50520.1 OPT family oligopeptide transporter [Candidatus Paceibacterota bacterium]
MALKQLNDEQVRTWTLEQKDRWWLDNVWKGDMPQLTLRSALTGMVLGGVLSLTNLYVGAKTGWTLGVGITSVILAFAAFKLLSALGLGKDFTVLENNAMQSIATAAGYMTAPMISSLAAYMMVTNEVVPMMHTLIWIMVISLLGVLFAFPLKRRFINDEQHPFPEGRAAGIVMDALHTGDAAAGLLKAKLLVITGGTAAWLKVMQSGAIMEKLRLGFLAVPEYLDGWIYRIGTLQIFGTDLRQLTVRPDTDFVMMAAGGLMGIRTGVSLMIGAVINYLILVPWMIAAGDIPGREVDGGIVFGFREITKWALWGGVAMMTTASLFAFFAKPQILFSAFRGLGKKRGSAGNQDPMRDIELPMSVFVVCIPLLGAVTVWLAHLFFGVTIWMGTIAIPLIFVFTVIGVNSTALTSITPTGALGKLTQLTYGILAPGNIKTNLMTAGITAEVASNASNLLMNIKPGYMLGAKPRLQAIGHVLGILAGAVVAAPVFYYVFLPNGPAQLVSDQYPMPAATIWRAVAELLMQGLGNLPISARWAVLIGALIGLALEGVRLATKGRFWLSGVGIGLATVIPFNTCFAMFLGSAFFWVAERIWSHKESAGNRILVQNQEPICAGVIAGGALMGIAVILIENFALGGH